jgi:hypothetical protein
MGAVLLERCDLAEAFGKTGVGIGHHISGTAY